MVANEEVELSATERRLTRAFAERRALDLLADGDDGPQNVSSWGPERRIRADVIARLLTGAAPGRPGGGPGLILKGARVTGALRLAHATIGMPAEFVSCAFDDGVDLAEASAVSIHLLGCYLPYLEAGRLRLRGVLTAHGCRMSWLSLYSARITEIDLSGTTLSRPGDTALNADLLIVEAAVYLQDLRIEGQVRLPGARIGGYLRLDGTNLSHAAGPALLAQGLRIETGLYALRGYKETLDPFSVTGQILLDGAQVSGGLHLDDARLDNPGGVALRTCLA
jgi:hypothetical protein